MKRQLLNQAQNNFNQQQYELINLILQNTPKQENQFCNDLARTSIAEVLIHINVDFETIIAAILLLDLEYGDVEISTFNLSIDQPILELAKDAQSLVNEERKWLSTLDVELTEEVGQSHHMMLLSLMKDVRVVFILLAHQVLKMRNLAGEHEAEQIKVAQETQTIFSPLANRLGIGQLKWELEDLSFRYLNASEYKHIANALEERRIDRESYMENIVKTLTDALSRIGIDANVYGRPKHIFSIWKKMQKKQLQFSDLYDVRAVRIIVKDIPTCYSCLSIVHDMWEFIPSEYDDYIAAPKQNNYQSLHTAVIADEGKAVEIQIRTAEMHAHAELGVAAHWQYKEGGKRDVSLEYHIESMRNLLESGTNSKIKLNQNSRIYVLSPKGHVVELPYLATPLDFAYHIHTDVGHRCRGAKVDGKMVQLTYQLTSGQTVEVITAKEAKPSRDWLVPHFGYLKSTRARAKVKHWFKREFRSEYIATGKSMLAKQVSILPSNDTLVSLSNSFNMEQIDDLYAAIGRGELGINQVLNALKATEEKSKEKQFVIQNRALSSAVKSDIVIDGVDALLTNLARCCKPMQGDNVVGFITNGRGVTIHRQDCQNVINLRERYPDRIVDVNWGSQDQKQFEVDIEVVALDRSGLLRDVTSVLSSEQVSVLAANTYTDRKSLEAKMRLTLEVNDPEKLKKVLHNLLKLRGVIEALRVK